MSFGFYKTATTVGLTYHSVRHWTQFLLFKLCISYSFYKTATTVSLTYHSTRHWTQFLLFKLCISCSFYKTATTVSLTYHSIRHWTQFLPFKLCISYSFYKIVPAINFSWGLDKRQPLSARWLQVFSIATTWKYIRSTHSAIKRNSVSQDPPWISCDTILILNYTSIIYIHRDSASEQTQNVLIT